MGSDSFVQKFPGRGDLPGLDQVICIAQGFDGLAGSQLNGGLEGTLGIICFALGPVNIGKGELIFGLSRIESRGFLEKRFRLSQIPRFLSEKTQSENERSTG